jgi:alpha,alpha-trehalase
MEVFELNPLFNDVQMSKVFPDGKTFADCVPKKDLQEIETEYKQQKFNTGFCLKEFVLGNFNLPIVPETGFTGNQTKAIAEHIESLWPALTRQPDTKRGSLIPLPHPYIVPGGRFGEVYYWDSYFTMLGLRVSGRVDMIESMVKNFTHLIHTIGFIPNGNRAYYLGRSQPPFYSLMIKLLAEIKGPDILIEYLPALEKEYLFWMKGAETLTNTNKTSFHVVKMPGGELINRYWDENETPRPESYREDVELAHQSKQNENMLYRHLRAGAESGWDYSSRWFADGKSFDTIHTTDIIPVDLNCLLFYLELLMAEAYKLKNENEKAEQYKLLAKKRKEAIRKYCWNDAAGFYMDYDAVSGKQKQSLSLAGVAPLFFKIATEEQAYKVAVIIKKKFLQPGGVVTTLENTGQQWDFPNGWAPLQWMTIKGLENYGLNDLAREIAQRWIKLNDDIFQRTGKLMEKYNVVDTHLEAGGGEYPGQDGFGWSNGVLLALIKKFA